MDKLEDPAGCGPELTKFHARFRGWRDEMRSHILIQLQRAIGPDLVELSRFEHAEDPAQLWAWIKRHSAAEDSQSYSAGSRL